MEVNDQHTITLHDRADLPPLLERHSEFTVWLIQKVRKFPKDLRYIYGEHLSRTCLAIMDGLAEAFYAPKGPMKVEKLQAVSADLEKLRLQLRMACNLYLLHPRSLHYATECLQQEGKMLGGWIKTEQQRQEY